MDLIWSISLIMSILIIFCSSICSQGLRAKEHASLSNLKPFLSILPHYPELFQSKETLFPSYAPHVIHLPFLCDSICFQTLRKDLPPLEFLFSLALLTFSSVYLTIWDYSTQRKPTSTYSHFHLEGLTDHKYNPRCCIR